MAFTDREQKVIEWGKANGKSGEDITDAIFRMRNGMPPKSADPDVQKTRFEAATPESTTGERLSDVGHDVSGTISRALEGEGEFEGQSPVSRGVKAVAAGASTVPRGAFALAPEPVRKGIEKVGDIIGKGFGKITGAVAQTDLFREIGELEAQGFISPETTPEFYKLRENLETVAAGGEIAGTILGAEGAVGTGQVISNVAKTTLKSSDNVLAKIKTKNPPVVDGNFVQKAVNSVRFNLSDIDPQVETVLKRSNFDEVNKYFQQAEAAKKNPAKNTPLEIAGNKAEEAFDAISEARIKAIEGKKAILAQVADERVPGNTINEVMSTNIQRMNEKFGAQINPNGTIAQAPGRSLTIDATDQKLLSEYVSRLNNLGVAPTVKEVDDFVDWAQGQLYKQSKTVSKLEAASDPVIRELQKTTGDLNGRLKTTVGGGYGEVNARISQLIELQDELSRALGADARKGGGLMKTLFSPTGGNTRRIFADIQKETGVDLFKEATLAKYAMENVGDVRQSSLLKQLDVATQQASELDLTKPASLVRFLRERADLDGQELANEIIRKQGLDTNVTPATLTKITPESEKALQGLSKRLNESSSNDIPKYLKDNKQAGFIAGGKIGSAVTPEGVAKKLDGPSFDAVTLMIEDIGTARLNPVVNRFLDDMKLNKASDEELVKFLKEATTEYERLNKT